MIRTILIKSPRWLVECETEKSLSSILVKLNESGLKYQTIGDSIVVIRVP